MIIYIIILILLFILLKKKLQNDDDYIDLNLIKDNFNKNKKKLYFNINNLPINKELDIDNNNINNLFKFIFNNKINLIKILDAEILSIENQKLHNIYYETNIGIINLILISNKEKKKEIFNSNEINPECNYLVKLKKIKNFKKIIDNDKNIDDYLDKKYDTLNKDLGFDVNQKVKQFDLNNII